jgi:hypothetical protein
VLVNFLGPNADAKTVALDKQIPQLALFILDDPPRAGCPEIQLQVVKETTIDPLGSGVFDGHSNFRWVVSVKVLESLPHPLREAGKQRGKEV